MPWSRSTALNTSLSMQSADASTPAPTYGTPASSSSPCTVPSSPNGPCSTGKTTSTSERVVATSLPGSRAGSSGRPADAELPAAVAADFDREHVVPGRLERAHDTLRRRDRDRVLARPAAEDHGNAALTAWWSSCRRACPPACWNWPTWMITTSPDLRVRARRRVGGLDDAVLRRIGDRIGDDRRSEALHR